MVAATTEMLESWAEYFIGIVVLRLGYAQKTRRYPCCLEKTTIMVFIAVKTTS